ncbi:unnamed protein product, partial [marine sediment metagenome]
VVSYFSLNSSNKSRSIINPLRDKKRYFIRVVEQVELLVEVFFLKALSHKGCRAVEIFGRGISGAKILILMF